MDNVFEAVKKKKSFAFIIIAAIAGVILMLWPSESTSGDTVSYSCAGTEYTQRLESSLEQMICMLDGVKNCGVMITLSSSYSYLYASDQKTTQTSDTHAAEKTVILRTQDGDEYPIVISEILPKVAGIAVVCTGGSEKTVNDIKYILSALFMIDESGIFVTCGE